MRSTAEPQSQRTDAQQGSSMISMMIIKSIAIILVLIVVLVLVVSRVVAIQIPFEPYTPQGSSSESYKYHVSRKVRVHGLGSVVSSPWFSC